VSGTIGSAVDGLSASVIDNTQFGGVW